MKAKSEILLEMRKVKFKFGDRWVLKSVNLSLKAQDTLVIMGQSGSGKSTILRLLLGILKPTSGSIHFKEKEITKLKSNELNQIRSGMGMVYQYSALLGSISVRDNIALPLQELSDKTAKEIDSIVDAKLDLVGLKNVKEKLPSELSGGMRKLVGLARALVLDPTLILFDEPSSGLDPINSVMIDDLIVRLREEHKITSIVVTHALESAFRIGTHIAMLHEGKIIEEGSPQAFRHSTNPIIHQFTSAYSKHSHVRESKDANSQK